MSKVRTPSEKRKPAAGKDRPAPKAGPTPEAVAWAGLADEVEPIAGILLDAIAIEEEAGLSLRGAAVCLKPTEAIDYLAALADMHRAAATASSIALDARQRKLLAGAARKGGEGA